MLALNRKHPPLAARYDARPAAGAVEESVNCVHGQRRGIGASGNVRQITRVKDKPTIQL